jgi:hypothetical protein
MNKFNGNTPLELPNVYGAVPMYLLTHPAVSGEAIRLFALLWIAGMAEDGIVSLSARRLAEIMGSTHTSVNRWIRELEVGNGIETRYVDGLRLIKVRTILAESDEEVKQIWAENNPKSGPPKKRGWVVGVPLVDHWRSTLHTYIRTIGITYASEVKAMTKSEWKTKIKSQSDDLRVSSVERKKRKSESRAMAKKKSLEVALDHTLDAKPTRKWTIPEIAAYFLRRYREQYPDTANVAADSILTQEAYGRLKNIQKRFIRTDIEIDDAYEEAAERCEEYLDYAFDNIDNLLVQLKIQGRMTVGVLDGYFPSIIAMQKGETKVKEAAGRGKASKGITTEVKTVDY